MLRLKELREEKGLTQAEIALKIDTNQSTVGRWENLTVTPSSEYIVKLADFFGCTADYLLGRTDDFGNVAGATSDATLTNDERSLLTYFRSFTDAERKNWLDLMKMSAIKTTSFSATNKI